MILKKYSPILKSGREKGSILVYQEDNYIPHRAIGYMPFNTNKRAWGQIDWVMSMFYLHFDKKGLFW